MNFWTNRNLLPFLLLVFLTLPGARGEGCPQQSIATGQAQRIEIQAAGGRIRLRGWDKPFIDLRCTAESAEEYSIAPSGGEIRLAASNPSQRELHLDIYLPARLAVTITSSSADIAVQGLSGAVAAESDSGRIDLFEVTGPVRAKSASGAVRFLGPVAFNAGADIQTGSGDIHITLSSGDFRITAFSDDSLFVNGRERRPDANSGGRTLLKAGKESAARLQLASAGGRIAIQAPVEIAQESPMQVANIPTAAPATPASSVSSQEIASNPGPGPNKEKYKVVGAAVDSGYAIRASVDYINLNVSVRDRANRTVPGLRQQDFLISEDGQPQEIEKLFTEETPFNLLLLLDVSGSTAGFSDLIKEASINFLRQLHPQDEVAVAVFSSDVDLLAPFSTDRREAAEAIGTIRSRGATAFYDALQTSVRDYMARVQGRKAIVVFTDGIDNRMEGRGAGSSSSFDELMRQIQETDTIIYPIFLDTESISSAPGFGVRDILGDILSGRVRRGSVRIGSGGRRYSEQARQEMEAIAEQTGGRMYAPRRVEDLAGTYRQIADDLRIQYTLSYVSSNPARDGKWRRVQVRIRSHPEYAARTRLGYYAARESRELGMRN